MKNNLLKTCFMPLKGFTLAEVLITLGIIGVVAAMTIPTLVKNYQKQVWVNQLKKTVSTLEQGFQKMMADEGVDNLWRTEMFANSGHFEESDKEDFYYQPGFCTSFYQPLLKKYFNIVKFDDEMNAKRKIQFLNDIGNWDQEVDYAYMYLIDGSVVGFDGYVLNGHSDKVAYLFIDVNGDKGPNEYGRDVFMGLMLTPQGLIKSSKGHPDCSTSKGIYGCYQKIIEAGWKMDY